MFTFKRLIGSSLFVFVLAGTVLTQESRAPIEMPREPVASGPLVTAAATAKRVRFVSPGTVVQLRLEVYNETGQKLFDTELHGGNVLDWHLQDGAGQRIAPGSYACVLTIKSLSGRLSQRVGLVTVNEEKATIEPAEGTQLSAAQQQIIGPVEGSAAFTILHNSEAQAITTVMHDGTNGQVARTRGALSFRVGDIFSGNDSEQMRLTEDGRLGIGTSDPQSTLDVAGTIRAERVIIAKPAKSGSTDKTVSAASAQVIDEQPLASGSGSQNQVAKWTDNTGTLGDSTITEIGGKVGIGTSSPDSLLHLAGTAGVNAITLNTPGDQRFRVQTVPGIENWGALTLNANYNSGWLLDNPAINGYFFKLDTRGGNVNGPNNGLWLYRVPAGANRHTDETPIFGVSSAAAYFAGNVGIGTTSPSAMLDVAGNINTSTQYNIGGSRVLSAPGGLGTNLFAGVGAGAANTTGCCNTFFGQSAGRDTTSGSLNSFFGNNAGLKNTTGVGNAFFGPGAGSDNTTGSQNAFFGNIAGASNMLGEDNSFFGIGAGFNNRVGSGNTIVGARADLGTNNLTNATAVGWQARVDQSNSLVLGSVAGVNGATASVNVGIGTTTPAQRLHVNGDILMTTGAGNAVQFGTPNAETGMSIIKTNTGRADLRFDGSTLKLITGPPNSGPPAATNGIVIDTAGRVGIGTTTPPARLTVKGPGTIDILRVEDASGLSGLIVRDDRIVAIGQLSSLEAASTQVCVDSFKRLSFCSSSLRYKQQVAPYGAGLDLIHHLRPISFTWKNNGTRDLGLGAEDVAKVEPLLVTHNDKGEIQGVKYDQLNVVLINGIKQQQGQIERQQVETKRQQDQIETLRTANVALNARLRLIERTLRNKHGSTRQRR